MRYRFSESELVPERYELRRRGESVALEPRVLEVLAYLVAHAERVVPKRELLARLWPDVVVSDAVLTAPSRKCAGPPGRQDAPGSGPSTAAAFSSPRR